MISGTCAQSARDQMAEIGTSYAFCARAPTLGLFTVRVDTFRMPGGTMAVACCQPEANGPVRCPACDSDSWHQTLQVSAVDRNADGAMCMAGEFVAFHPWSIGGPGVAGSVD